MAAGNLFVGESFKAQFALLVYKMLLTRQWITYLNVMTEYVKDKKEIVEALEKQALSKCKQIGDLKKAFPEVCRAIKDRQGDESIEVEGSKQKRRFRYVGLDNDPLADMINAKVINNLRQYWKFCQNSSGFFPESWLEYYFKDCQDLLDFKARKKSGKQVISASVDRIYRNIEYLPSLFEAIINKCVLEIDYKPFEEEEKRLIFHPHYIKEYNGRWHLFGYAVGYEPQIGYNIALDRIQSPPREKYKLEYIAAPEMFYENYFKNVVGVSHPKNSKVEEVIIRVHSYYIYKLTDTKPLHNSQTVIKEFGDYEDGCYAEIMVKVEINNEFIGRILQMGDGFEVVAPDCVRKIFEEKIEKLVSFYKK